MNRKNAFTTSILVAIVGTCLAAQPASANIGSETYSQKVKFKDLDLSQPEDAQSLLRRIRRAANMVCTGSPSRTALTAQSRQATQCIRQAQNDAVAKINHPVVTAMYTGAPAPVQVATK